MSLTPRPMHAGVLTPVARFLARLRAPMTVQGILGPDVSEFQPGIDWPTVGRNRLFAFTRATFGTTIVDPTFTAYQRAMRQSLKYRAFYHFLVANVSASVQASVFAQVVGRLQPGENVMLDWEDYGPTGGLPSAAQALTFCSTVETMLGLAPNSMLVYSAGSTPDINRPRIIASYGAQPRTPWIFWQYTDGSIGDLTGVPVPGIGACDENVFVGSEEQLAANFLGGAPAPRHVPDLTNTAGGSVIQVLGTPTGRTDVVMIGGDGAVWWTWGQGMADVAKHNGTSIGGQARAISCLYWSDYSNIDVVAVGPDGTVWWNVLNVAKAPAASGWTQAAGWTTLVPQMVPKPGDSP